MKLMLCKFKDEDTRTMVYVTISSPRSNLDCKTDVRVTLLLLMVTKRTLRSGVAGRNGRTLSDSEK